MEVEDCAVPKGKEIKEVVSEDRIFDRLYRSVAGPRGFLHELDGQNGKCLLFSLLSSPGRRGELIGERLA